MKTKAWVMASLLVVFVAGCGEGEKTSSTATNPLIGSWLIGTVGSGQEVVVTFLDSTHYTMAHNGIADSGGQPGIESGTYTWNAGTGAFTASQTIDTIGDWGFSHPQGSVTVSVSGDTLTFNDTVEGSYVFARVQ